MNDALATRQDAHKGDAGTTVARRFPASCVSVSEARHFLREHLRGDRDEDLESLALMLSELATNAVQHADTPFEVDITVAPESEGRSVHVRVTDEAPGFPVPQAPPPDGLRGRGLRIVESLADAWGIEVQHGRTGKTVWFTSRLEPARSPLLSPVERADRFGQHDEREVGITVGAIAQADLDAVEGFEAWPIPGVRSVLDCLNDGVVATDEHGVIHYANVAALDGSLALLEASLRSAPTGDPDTVSDFVIDAMTADERSSDDIMVLAVRRTRAGTGGGSAPAGPHARRVSEEGS